MGLNVRVCVISKGMEDLLPYYHFQDSISSTSLNPPFFIDTIKTWWEHDDTLHADRLYEFLHYYCVLVNVSGYKPHIVDFYV